MTRVKHIRKVFVNRGMACVALPFGCRISPYVCLSLARENSAPGMFQLWETFHMIATACVHVFVLGHMNILRHEGLNTYNVTH